MKLLSCLLIIVVVWLAQATAVAWAIHSFKLEGIAANAVRMIVPVIIFILTYAAVNRISRIENSERNVVIEPAYQDWFHQELNFCVVADWYQEGKILLAYWPEDSTKKRYSLFNCDTLLVGTEGVARISWDGNDDTLRVSLQIISTI